MSKRWYTGANAVLFLQIRQAETAMRDGRLDEAYRLVRDDKLQAHRRGQELVGRLARALVDRGRQHLIAQRWPQAQADCEKAAKLGGNLLEAADLHKAIGEAAGRRQEHDRRRANTLAAVRQRMENGRLSMCNAMLDDLDAGSASVAALRDRADALRVEAHEYLDRTEAAVAAGQWDAAVDNLLQAKRLHPSRPVAELVLRVIGAVNEEISQAIDAGRLNRAASLADILRPLAGENVPLAEVTGFLRQCRQVLVDVEHGKLGTARKRLGRLTVLRPEANWLTDACRTIGQAARCEEQVQGGPLGLLSGSLSAAAAPGETERPLQGHTHMTGEDTIRLKPGDCLPNRFLLHVDGAGSYLVARNRCVTIGPVSASQRPDVGLMARSGLTTVTLERVDEDYFVVSPQPVSVNAKQVTRKLLADGDMIALSPRCRLKFSLPSAASTTAVLQLSGNRLPHGDIRRVILLDRSLLIGPGRSTHARLDTIDQPIVLNVHDGRLVCRSDTETKVNGCPLRRSDGIPLDAHVRIGAASFVMTKV